MLGVVDEDASHGAGEQVAAQAGVYDVAPRPADPPGGRQEVRREAPEDLRVEPDPSEVMEAAWIDLTDLAAEVVAQPELFTPWLRIYLDRSRDRIFGAAA